MAKRRADVGTLYKGSPGQWSWLAHRVTGLAVTLFLFAHIVDTAVVGWGPDAYNRVTEVYHNWAVRILELGLVAAVRTLAGTSSTPFLSSAFMFPTALVE